MFLLGKKIVVVILLFAAVSTAAFANEILSPEPCKTIETGVSLALDEVVELALCGNPQTREVWANAR